MLVSFLGIGTTSLASNPAASKTLLQKNVSASPSVKVSAQPSLLNNSMRFLAPKGMYVVVDTAQNRLEVREGE
jgi:hypothetical protein